VAAPAEPQTSPARAWAACALIVLAAVVLVVGLLVLDSEAKGSLAWAVGAPVMLVAVATFLST